MVNEAAEATPCFDKDGLPARDDEMDGIWDVQWCTEMMVREERRRKGCERM